MRRDSGHEAQVIHQAKYVATKKFLGGLTVPGRHEEDGGGDVQVSPQQQRSSESTLPQNIPQSAGEGDDIETALAV